MDNSFIRQKAYLAAQSLIKAYVLRGDSLKHLADSHLGCACREYYASIGGYANGKSYPTDTIVVTKLDGAEIVPQVFKLKYVYDMVLESKRQPTLFDCLC